MLLMFLSSGVLPIFLEKHKHCRDFLRQSTQLKLSAGEAPVSCYEY